MSHDVDPAMLAALEEERSYLETSGSRVRRLKLVKNEEYVFRWLPVELGHKKLFYARIYFHWINRRPFFCGQLTHSDFGGTGETCELCSFARKLESSKDREAQNQGWRATAIPQWLTYGLLLEVRRANERELSQVSEEEKFLAWEFPLNKSLFDDMLNYFARSIKRNPPHGILDLVTGNDFYIKMKKRGYLLEKLRESPIDPTTDQEKFDKIVDKIWGSITPWTARIPRQSDIEMAIERVERAVESGGRYDDDDAPRGGGRGYGGRGKADDDDDDDRGSRGRGRGRDDEDEDDDDDRYRGRRGDDDDAPRGRASEREERPRARQEEREERPREREERPRARQEEREERPREREERPRENQEREERRSRADRGREEVKEDRKPSERMVERSVAPPPASSSRVAPPPASRKLPGKAESSVDEDDNVDDENRDPAPPKPVSTEDDAPPPVTPPKDSGTATPAVTPKPASVTPGSPPKTSLSDRLSRGINAAKNW